MSAVAQPPATDAPSPAVAPPPGNPRFDLMDSVRGLAVLVVVGYHVGSLTGTVNGPVVGRALIALVNQGVILFFVLSAFLLYRPFVAARAAGRARPSVSRYARRRTLRIVPAYWVALTLLAVFPGVIGVFTGDWWRFYGFLQVYADSTTGRGIPTAWSLCVEVTFYVMLPLWAIAVRRLPTPARTGGWVGAELAALAAVSAFGVFVQVLAARHVIDDRVGQALPGQMTWFALGMALAVWSVWEHEQPTPSRAVLLVRRRAGACWLGALLAAVGLTALVPAGGLLGLVIDLRAVKPYGEIAASTALTAVLATLTVLPAVWEGQGVPRRVLRLGPLVWLGMVSYGVYLYHLTVVEVLWLPQDPSHFSARGLGLVRHLHLAPTIVLFALTLAGSCGLAALSHRFVERPFLRRKEPRHGTRAEAVASR